MATEVGSFTAGSTGNKTIFLNGSFTPSLIEFDVGPRTATNETDVQRSSGWTDGTRQAAIATFSGAVNKGTRESTSKCIMHYKDNSGATLVTDGSFVSFGSGQFVVNMTTIDANYTIRFKAFS